MYKAIIFDLDGTLLDTLDDLTDAVNAALAKCGLPLREKAEVKAFVGNGIKKLMERAVAPRLEYADEALVEFRRYYLEHCSDKTKEYEGITPLALSLKERGIKTAVVSNKADFALKKLAEEYFSDLFLEAIGENEEKGIRKKPAPDSLLAVMEKLGVSKAETVYVGDSEVDIETANNAGVDCICVTWGFRTKAFLQERGGQVFVDTPKEILNFVRNEL